MARIVAIAIFVTSFVTPFVVSMAHAQSVERDNSELAADPFNFDSTDLDTIRYSRINEADIDAEFDTENAVEFDRSRPSQYADRQTELSVSLKPAKPKFSLKNGFGLNMFSRAQPAMEVESGRLGKNRLVESIPDLHNGFAYSAGLKVEHEDENIDGTAYVSSGLLGLSYGRLGTLWYGGLDVNVEQFVYADEGAEPKDILSVDITTGRRLGWTGTSSGSPLWMLSVQGNLDLQSRSADNGEEHGDWFLNPSLFWQNPGFTFSAQVQLPVPVESTSPEDTLNPDYRLRAIFEKQF